MTVNRLEQTIQKVADWSVKRPNLFLFALSVLFLWPILLNGGPYYFGDTEGYLRGGALALTFAGELVAKLFASSSGGESAVEAATSGIYGVRSVAYAVFAFLGKWPGDTAILAAWVQSVLVIFVLDTLFDQFDIRDRAPKVLLGIWAVLVFLTPMAWYAVYITPDVFAGISILAVGLLTVYQNKISMFRRIILSGLICFSVLAHLSMVPILGLLGALSGLLFLSQIRRLGILVTARAYAWVAVPIGLGFLAAIAINTVGFDEPSVTGKRYPILLARSIEDGPAYWYLTERCAEGAEYVVCEIYPDETLPKTAGEFLWEPGGIRDIATPEQVARIRMEETEIVQAALQRYPFAAITRSATLAVRQVFFIGLMDHRMEYVMRRNAEGELYTSPEQPRHLAMKGFFEYIFLASFAASVIVLIWMIRSKAFTYGSPSGRLFIMVTLGILINAGICGALSAVTDRYQGRVVWIFIAVIAVLAWQHFQAREDGSDTA